MQNEYKPNRLACAVLANGLEGFCFFRISCECGAQIPEAELSVRVRVKRPSSARPEASAALSGVTGVTSLGFRHDVLPSRALLLSPRRTARHQCSFKLFWTSTTLFSNNFCPTDVPLHIISFTTRSLAAVFSYSSGMVKSQYYLSGTLQSTIQPLCTHWGLKLSENRCFHTTSSQASDLTETRERE
jgi:hypothetical protein